MTPPDSPAAPASAGRETLAGRLDALLPQTQCTRCGYPDCRAYAQALADGAADLDRCPPGGAEGVRRLAEALGRPPKPLDPAHGHEGPRHVVFIDERACIGCTLCLQACPVDAIIGAPKRMHTVIESACTGCDLCLPACPVDCILTEDASGVATGWDAWSPAQAEAARERHERRRHRLARDAREHARRLAERAAAARPAASSPTSDAPAAGAPASAAPAHAPESPPVDARRAAIEAALARARQRAKMRP